MKYKIIVDSSSNLKTDYIKRKDIGFEVVPLTVILGEKEYVDNDSLDLGLFMEEIKQAKNLKSSTACPSSGSFLDSIKGADYYFVITISKKLSGCFNAAETAISSLEDPSKVFLMDSKSVAGSMMLLVEKLVELIEANKSFEQIKSEIISYRNKINLLFILDSFENLIKNGRMSRLTAAIATLIRIKPVCYGADGEIKIKEKAISMEGAFKRLVVNIGKLAGDIKNKAKKIIICHTQAPDRADKLKVKIEEYYGFENIRVIENRGLCSYYSLQNGIIVSFD